MKRGGRSKVAGTMGDIASNNNPSKPAPHLTTKQTRATPRGRINLKAVAEVLQERGLDPTSEIVDVLEATRLEKRFDKELGHEVEVEVPVLDPDTRARINLELLQYVQPKLKSIEVKAKVASAGFDVSTDQGRRLAEAFLKGEALKDEEKLQ